MSDYSAQIISNAAFLQSQAACAMAESAAMTAENMQRQHLGQSMAYVEKDFMDRIDKYGIGHNAALTTLRMNT